MCVADLQAVRFLPCGILIYSTMQQSPTIYVFIYLHVSGVQLMNVMSKIITLRIMTLFSLQFVQNKQKNVPFL